MQAAEIMVCVGENILGWQLFLCEKDDKFWATYFVTAASAF